MKKLMALFLAVALVGCSSGSGGSSSVSGTINVYTRDASSGTREAFEKAGDFTGSLSKSAIEVSSNGDMATKVGADKNGIGYVSLTTDFEGNKITALQFEGVTPSEESVLDGTYKLQRPFDFVTRASGDFSSDEEEQLVAAFIDFMQNSKEGMAIVKKAGGIVDTSTGKAWAELAKNHPIVNQDNSGITITTAGSTSVEKTVKAALEGFQPMAGNFQFAMNQTGSSDGWKRVLGSEKDGANRSSIGFASRNFKDGEEPLTDAKLSGTYCLDAVVTVVSASNTNLTSITKDQIKQIFTGEVANWEDVK